MRPTRRVEILNGLEAKFMPQVSDVAKIRISKMETELNVLGYLHAHALFHTELDTKRS